MSSYLDVISDTIFNQIFYPRRGDRRNTSFCGYAYNDASENCSAEMWCPTGQHAECSGGRYCWTIISGCNIHDFVVFTSPPTLKPSPKPTSTTPNPTPEPTPEPTTLPPTEKPTHSPISETDERNSFYCGTSRSDANEKCSVQCPHLTGCPTGETCFSATDCHTMPPSTKPTPRPTTAIAAPVPLSMETDLPTGRPSPRPTHVKTERPTTLEGKDTDSPTISERGDTSDPTISEREDGIQVVYFPDPKSLLPKPPKTNVQRIWRIVESVRTPLNDLFVVETRGGDLLPSTLYTFDGFVEALVFYTNMGLGQKYFYLGQTGQDMEVEYAIANLALFLAKMLGIVQYGRCDPDLIACGQSALSQSFEKQKLRVECSVSALNCPSETGCVCVLGIMNHYLASNDKYPGVDICETNTFQSICSTRFGSYGDKLRWIAGMTHWVHFIQQYHNDDWNYIDQLHNFVQRGMVDSSFVSTVAEISVIETQHATTDQFVRNFFKVIIHLSEGMSQTISADTTTTFPTMAMTTLPAQTHSPILTTKPSSTPHSSTDKSSIIAASPTDSPSAPPTEQMQTSYYPSTSQAEASSPPPTEKRHWEYEDAPWYREFFSPRSRGTRVYFSCCWKRIIMTVFTYFLVL